MALSLIFLALMFLTYNYFTFILIDQFLERPRLNRLQSIPVAVLNTAFAGALLLLGGLRSWQAYLIFAALLFLELCVFYRDKWTRALFCMLACFVHMMALRSLCVSGLALVQKISFFEVATQPLWSTLSLAIAFVLLNLAVALVIKFVPATGVRIINQHSDQLYFMISWLSVLCCYLLINAVVYDLPNSSASTILNQIATPIAILMGTYVVLFYAMKTSVLLGYKEKTVQLQNTVEKERQYRQSIDKDVFRIIEVNYSKNLLLSGFEDYKEKLGDVVSNYSEMLAFMISTAVHPEDTAAFLHYSSPATVVKEYNQGKTESVFDYRRLMPDGSYLWMQVMMVFMRDEGSPDVCGFVKIKNIDQEKRQQLQLQHQAERDQLTGLYNKATTGKLLTEYLESHRSGASAGVLFVIDIDNFKAINDKLGHLYGDAVLSELSESLQTIFRDDDIVGRIGGDEFLVFAKGALSKANAIEKADGICRAFLRTYRNELAQDITVSSSIGIALFPKDGVDFERLFQCADAALYAAKARGKNCHCFYESNLELSYVSNRTEIDTHGSVQKSFRDNRIEYVFRLLYGSEDTKSAIESVLELIAKNFAYSRANVFEFDAQFTHFSCAFEWCARGIDAVGQNYIDLPLSNFSYIIDKLEKSGGMFTGYAEDFPPHIEESYVAIGIKSIVHFSILAGDKMIGVIAFQNCTDESFHIAAKELEELRVICQVLSVFMAKQLSASREMRHHEAIEAVMDNTNSLAYVIDIESYEVFYENQNVRSFTGHPSIGEKCYSCYRGYDKPCDDCPAQHLSDGTKSCTLDLYTAKFDLYTQTSASLIDWENGRKAMLISSVDITEYKKAEQEQRERALTGINENYYKQISVLLGHTKIGTWDWDIPSRRIRYNDEYLQMLGYMQEEMCGSVEEWESAKHPEDLPAATKALQAYIAGETEKYELEIRMKHKDGRDIWTRDVGRIVERDAEGTPTRIIGGQLNIDAIKRSQEQLNRLAYRDTLTGLPNLVKFKLEAKDILEQNQDKTFVFSKLDIINFKMVNDFFGSEVGDIVIQKVAESLVQVREQKKLTIGSLARTHDDVFLLLDEFVDEAREGISERVQIFEELLHDKLSSLLGNHRIKFRYGRYFPQRGELNVDHAIECATLALSRAKESSTSNAFDFDLNIMQEIRREIEITNSMQRALENEEIVVFLQGKYSLIDESLCGAESLARWRVDEDTMLSPADFIPIFEKTGFITELDMFMFERCCALLADWKKQGLALVPISVNFSRMHLANPHFVEDIAGIAKRYEIPPAYLEVELTETIVMDSEYDLIGFIAKLHEHGFQMSIDDFGTGYSSLGMLKNLNVDAIKLDRSFFVDAQENVKAHSLLSNMLNMIIDLGIKTVAEGVEEKSQVELLRKLNCDVIQGYYFARPISAQEFTRKIHNEVNNETLQTVNDRAKRFSMRKNNELLIDMMDSMPLAFTLWDKENRIVQCNREALDLIGFTSEDEMMNRLPEVIPEIQPDGQRSMETIVGRIQLAFEHGYGRYSHWYFRHLEGAMIPCEVILVRIFNKGEFMVACYVRDMRLQMETERNIKEEQSKLQALIDATPMSVGLWDRDMNIVMCNSSTQSLFGIESKQEFLGHFGDFSPSHQPGGRESMDLAHERIAEAFQTGNGNFTWLHQRKSGEQFAAEITLVKLALRGEDVVAAFTRDMSKQLESAQPAT